MGVINHAPTREMVVVGASFMTPISARFIAHHLVGDDLKPLKIPVFKRNYLLGMLAVTVAGHRLVLCGRSYNSGGLRLSSWRAGRRGVNVANTSTTINYSLQPADYLIKHPGLSCQLLGSGG